MKQRIVTNHIFHILHCIALSLNISHIRLHFCGLASLLTSVNMSYQIQI